MDTHAKVAMKKALVCLTMASLAIVAVSVPVQAASNLKKVFNSLPAQLPGNVPSVGFEATQTDEFGDQIRLAPGGQKLKKVTVAMSSWACEAGTWSTADCVTTQGATFNESIKLTLYKANNVDPTLPGAEIATRKRTFAIPFRPSADAANCEDPNKWYSSEDDACYNAKAVKIAFEFSGLKIPKQLIYGISYNTSTSGNSPHGTARSCYVTTQGCPDDSLNVGAGAGLPALGFDVYADGVFVDQETVVDCTTSSNVADTFSLDACDWAGFNPLVRFQVKK